jgi:hypothetical protein
LYILAIRLAHTDDLSSRIPDKLLQRPGQMRLIEVAQLIDRVEERFALLEESFRPFDALELADMTLCQTRSLQETCLTVRGDISGN